MTWLKKCVRNINLVVTCISELYIFIFEMSMLKSPWGNYLLLLLFSNLILFPLAWKIRGDYTTHTQLFIFIISIFILRDLIRFPFLHIVCPPSFIQWFENFLSWVPYYTLISYYCLLMLKDLELSITLHKLFTITSRNLVISASNYCSPRYDKPRCIKKRRHPLCWQRST